MKYELRGSNLLHGRMDQAKSSNSWGRFLSRFLVAIVLAGLPISLVGGQYIVASWNAIKGFPFKRLAKGDKGNSGQGIGNKLKPLSQLPFDSPFPDDTIRGGSSLSVHNARFERQDTVYDVLAANGILHREILEILLASRPYGSLSRIKPGNGYEVAVADDGVHWFLIQIGDDRQIRVYRTRKGSFRARLERIPYDIKIVRISVNIHGTLYGTLGRAGVPISTAMKLGEIFEWVIDFYKDLKNGDNVELLLERRYLDGSFRGFGKILAARIKTRGKEFSGVLFEGGRDFYYTPEGQTLRRAFLRSPLKYTRISSRFSNRRFHPILKRFRAHHGVDYAAPQGTPVRSVADGKIIWAAWKGAAGKTVKIRHSRGYETSYFHLSRIGNRIRLGVKVRQGRVIGFVGSTGLSTGPHLDFRLKRFGVPMNPLSARVPAGNPVSRKRLFEFREMVKVRNSQFERAPLLRRSSNLASARIARPIF